MTKKMPSAPVVELPPYLVDAISCYSTFVKMGFDPNRIQVLITSHNIILLFMFGSDERYYLAVADLPEGVVGGQIVGIWRPALEHWNTLSEAEANYLVATSNALEIVPSFMAFMSSKGHMPVVTSEGARTDYFQAPCPFCGGLLECKFDPANASVLHSVPVCSVFLQQGANGTMAELNRRAQLRMEGFVGEIPQNKPRPS
jgi:hypothetical protein